METLVHDLSLGSAAWTSIVAAAVLLIPLAYVAFVRLFDGRCLSENTPPVFRGYIPFLGFAIEFSRDGYGLMRRFQKQAGDVFTLLISGRQMTFVLDPLAITTVLTDRALSFAEIAKDISMNVFKMDSDVYVSADDELHQIYNKHLQGSSLKEMTVNMQIGMEDCLYEYLKPTKEWTAYTSGFYDFVHRIIFESSSNAIFGNKFFSNHAWQTFKLFDKFFPLLIGGMPNFLVKDGMKARGILSQYLTDKIGLKTCTFISERHRVLSKYTNENLKISDIQLALLWASQANTIPAVFWTAFYILKDPALLKSVLKEIESSIQESIPSETERVPLVQFNTGKMPLIDACINETLRLVGFSLTLRQAVKDYELKCTDKTYSIPKGTFLAVFPNIFHMDPEIFPEPKKYDPYRFAPQLLPGADPNAEPVFKKNGKVVKNAFIPFGGGVSMCPGRFFAKNEIKVFLVMLLHHFDIRLKGKYADGSIPPLDSNRGALGIIPPQEDVDFEFRLKHELPAPRF